MTLSPPPGADGVRLTKEPKVGKRAALAAAIASLASVETTDDLESAFQAGVASLEKVYGGMFATGLRQACEKLRWEGANPRAWVLVDQSDLGRFIPRLGDRRRYTLDGKTFRVGYGGNGAGERYAWASAEAWAEGVLREAGIPDAAIREVWQWRGWPWRQLRALERHLSHNKEADHG